MAGLAMIVIGLVLTLMFVGGGAARTANTKGEEPYLLLMGFSALAISVMGICLVGWGVFGGLIRVRRQSKPGQPTTVARGQIVARYAYDAQGRMSFDVPPDDAWEHKFYVKIAFEDARRGEFRAPWPVYCMCGEGLLGTVEFQGDWIGKFTPDVAAAPPRQDMIDPFTQEKFRQ